MDENVPIGSPAWIIIDKLSGIPTSWATSSAMSAMRAASASPIRVAYLALSLAETCDHSAKAALAAWTAASTSSADPSGTVPMTSSVVESITSIVSLLCGATHAPSI